MHEVLLQTLEITNYFNGDDRDTSTSIPVKSHLVAEKAPICISLNNREIFFIHWQNCFGGLNCKY